MLSQAYFNFCVNAWSFLAQATPAAAKATNAAPAAAKAAEAATTAPPAAPVAPAVPMTDPTALPGLEQAPMQLGQQSMAYNLGHSFVLFVYFVICISLITCVMFQTTKAEGLSGVIGGQVSSPLTGRKKSADEMLSMWTGRLAIAFIVSSLLIWFVFGRHA
ncbi:MAG: preprotein translocase subunit SecG [Armatimonadetes bacterium]|nr:preprotein translocase subunit SecG [Armatimonadota bacterium]